MHVEAIDPASGKPFTLEASHLTEEHISEINDIFVSDEQLKNEINRLNISADAKSLLFKIAKVTIKAGKFIVKVGRKILDIISSLFRAFPEAGFGLILGAVLGTLVASVPVIGVVLGGIIIPLFSAFGLAMGLHQDISNKALAREIVKAEKSFESLKD